MQLNKEFFLRDRKSVGGWRTLNFYFFKVFPVGINKITRWDICKKNNFNYTDSFWKAFKLGIKWKINI